MGKLKIIEETQLPQTPTPIPTRSPSWRGAGLDFVSRIPVFFLVGVSLLLAALHGLWVLSSQTRD